MNLELWIFKRLEQVQKIKVSSKNLIIFDLRNIYNAREIKDLGFKYFGTGK